MITAAIMSNTIIQMRRVGNPATCHGVKDTFRLFKNKNVIGRNSMVADFYINSSLHPKLISREHAIISQARTENGIVELTIHDKSINGTFVNDSKIQGSIHLSVGDTVTFGHLQGIKVKAWEIAKQPNSEFRFKLEEVIEQPASNLLSRQPLSTYNHSPAPHTLSGNSTSSTQPLNTSYHSPNLTLSENSSSNRQPLSTYNHSPTQMLTGKVNETQIGYVKEVVRIIESRPDETQFYDEENRQVNKSGSRLEEARRTLSLSKHHVSDIRERCLGSSDGIKEKSKEGTSRTSEKRESVMTSEQIKLQLDSDCTTTLFNKSTILPPSNLLPKQLILAAPACRVQSTNRPETRTVDQRFNFPFLGAVASTSPSREDESADGDTPLESDEDIFAITSKVKNKLERLIEEEEEEESFSPNFPSFFDDVPTTSVGTSTAKTTVKNKIHYTDVPTTSIQTVGTSTAKTTVKNKILHTDVPTTSIQTVGTSTAKTTVKNKLHHTRRKSIPQTGVKSALHTFMSSNTGVSTRKRKSDGVLPSAKRTTKAVEVCSALECFRPTGIMIPWVQCDDCDQWFHTICAGCKFEEVRKSSAAFHCGCL